MIEIFTKNKEWAILTIDSNSQHSVICNTDTRFKQLNSRIVYNPFEAIQVFENASLITRERGWNLVYKGERNWG